MGSPTCYNIASAGFPRDVIWKDVPETPRVKMPQWIVALKEFEGLQDIWDQRSFTALKDN